MFHTPNNILPFDGTAIYYGTILESEIANNFFEILLKNIEWKRDKVVIFGKEIITKRKVAWYGESDISYTYSGTKKSTLYWTKELIILKELIEKKTNSTYNSCLLNLYHSGEEGIAWHSDNEKELEENGSIASLSLGAERRFLFKHRESKNKIELLLENGSLLEMKDEIQKFWLHSLPKTKTIVTPRINLTFRKIVS